MYNTKCVFSMDEEQVLSNSEIEDNICNKVTYVVTKLFKLKGKIRTNKEIAAFIIALFDNNKINHNYPYDNIELIYCTKISQANRVIQMYEDKGYIFIKHTPSLYKRTIDDEFLSDYNSHRVIGQEFDNIIVFLDNCFGYNSDKKLVSLEAPNPNHILVKLLFQELTRCREKLCLVIIDNESLFKRLLNILQK